MTSSRSFASRSAGVPWRPVRREPLEAPLHDRQVGQDELEIEVLEVAPRVHVAVRMRHATGPRTRGRRGGAHPSRATGPRCSAGQLLGPDPALGRGGRRGQVDVRDVGLDDLLRLEDLGEAVEPRVGHLDHPDVELQAAEPPVSAWPRVRVLKTVVLPLAGQADDRAIAARTVSSRRPGSTTLTSGWPVEKRRRLSQKSSTLRSSTRPDDHDVWA